MAEKNPLGDIVKGQDNIDVSGVATAIHKADGPNTGGVTRTAYDYRKMYDSQASSLDEKNKNLYYALVSARALPSHAYEFASNFDFSTAEYDKDGNISLKFDKSKIPGADENTIMLWNPRKKGPINFVKGLSPARRKYDYTPEPDYSPEPEPEQQEEMWSDNIFSAASRIKNPTVLTGQ